MNHKGYSLIELMIVVVIIGILAALAIPKFLETTRKAKESEAKPVLKQIYTLQNAYYQLNDTYAPALTDLDGWTTPDNSRFTFNLSNVTSTTFTAYTTNTYGLTNYQINQTGVLSEM